MQQPLEAVKSSRASVNRKAVEMRSSANRKTVEMRSRSDVPEIELPVDEDDEYIPLPAPRGGTSLRGRKQKPKRV